MSRPTLKHPTPLWSHVTLYWRVLLFSVCHLQPLEPVLTRGSIAQIDVLMCRKTLISIKSYVRWSIIRFISTFTSLLLRDVESHSIHHLFQSLRCFFVEMNEYCYIECYFARGIFNSVCILRMLHIYGSLIIDRWLLSRTWCRLVDRGGGNSSRRRKTPI